MKMNEAAAKLLLPPANDHAEAPPPPATEAPPPTEDPHGGRRKRKDDPDWLECAVVDDRGRAIANLANVLVALRNAPELRDVFTFDQMKRAVIVHRPLPIVIGAEARNGSPTPRPIADADHIQVQEFLQRSGLPRVGCAVIRDAIALRAEERGFHPVKDYLEALAWDGRKRLDGWLTRHLGAADNEYTRVIGRLFLISAVARIFEPGCKVDYVLVLQGKQGFFKSSVCQTLAGPWFSDALPDISHKDANQHLRDKWFVEIAELSAFGRADIEFLKSFITRTIERYRASYGRGEVFEPRQCVFIATTNTRMFIKDDTGGRRFWPVDVKEADIPALAANRNQLFAEAVAAYRAGENWWPKPEFERRVIAAEQDARREVDLWQETVAAFVTGRQSVRPGQIAREALKIETTRLATSDSHRITAILDRLGWQKSERKDSTGNFPWFPPPAIRKTDDRMTRTTFPI
jgi:predicted P-loop ATPase